MPLAATELSTLYTECERAAGYYSGLSYSLFPWIHAEHAILWQLGYSSIGLVTRNNLYQLQVYEVNCIL